MPPHGRAPAEPWPKPGTTGKLVRYAARRPVRGAAFAGSRETPTPCS